MKKIAVLILLSCFLTRCASMGGTFEKEKVQKIKKIAVIGFSYDAPLETSEHLMSALSGKEHSAGPGLMGSQKMEAAQAETEFSKDVYDHLTQNLKKAGWRVSSASDVKNSTSVKAFYNKAVKVGYFPLEKGYGRFEREGIPQYIHVASLAGKSEFAKMAKELGVDAVAVAYVHAKGSQSIPLVTKINHSATVTLQVFDPLDDKQIMNFSSNGTEVEGLTKTKIGKDFEASVQKGTLASLETFEHELVEKINK